MRTRSRAALVLALLTLVASSAQAGPDDPPERWRIQGNAESDGCGGRIILAARNLRFSARTMFADVVNRSYALTRRGQTRIASGQFDADYACDGTQITETWTLRQTSPDVLEGNLTSTWRLRPQCQACTIRFDIRAVRVRPRRR